jgi:hypothetical protein
MAIGTGYFDKSTRLYKPKDSQTWDDYQASSAGDDWDSWELWEDLTNLLLPMEFETDFIDTSYEDNFLITTNIGSGGFWHTYIYNHPDDTDSAGDLTPSGISWNEQGPYYPGDSVPALRGRFFKIKIVFEAADSAGEFSNLLQRFRSVEINATTDKISESIKVNEGQHNNLLPGSIGNRIYLCKKVSIPTNVQVTTGLTTDDPYVQAQYVDDTDSAGGTEVYVESIRRVRAITYANSGNGPTIVLNQFDMNSFSKNKRVDAPFYLMVEGFPYVTVDEHGNITRS